MNFSNSEAWINQRLSEEFLEDRLGVPATAENISLFVEYIRDFEQEIILRGECGSLDNAIKAPSEKNNAKLENPARVLVKVRGKCHV